MFGNLHSSTGSPNDLIHQFSLALNDLRSPACITDAASDFPGASIVSVNAPLCRLTGYRASELNGQPPHIFRRFADEAALPHLSQSVRAGVVTIDGTIIRKDGGEHKSLWRVAPFVTDYGSITHWVFFEISPPALLSAWQLGVYGDFAGQVRNSTEENGAGC